MSEDLRRLAEQSAETDLAFLLRAKEEAKKRMKDNPTPETVGAFTRARAATQEEVARLGGEGSPVRAYKTQLDAVAFLRDAGFKVSKSLFNSHVKARKVPRNADGHFEEPALLGYAQANLATLSQRQNRALSDAEENRLSADAELKRYQAARAKLKLEKESGQLMRREEHERDLGARALFFRNEVRTFIHLYGAEIIHVCGGDEARLRDLLDWWHERTAVWMDAWSGEREFLVDTETGADVEAGDDPADGADGDTAETDAGEETA
ncbi:hypothetical protein [uncultured Desulfovibrio sp.]|uniref:hypothetical protein n=1 Tax=uncultured Desulfovibrio sp. TaxID=167968 RepID=UPI002612C42C|nr:hypothetical protein [uncultured Desulfovibrio sp.]